MVHRELDDAEAIVKDWLAIHPQDANAHLAATRLAYNRGQGEAASRSLQAATKFQAPADELAKWNALLLAASGKEAEAEPSLIASLERARGPQPELCLALARRFLETYRLKQAKIVLEKWANDEPSDPRPYLWMTQIDRRSDGGVMTTAAAAADHYRQALDRDPENIEARSGLAEALRETHQLDASIATYTALLTDQHRDVDGYLGRARAYLTKGEEALATRDFEAVIEIEPGHADALRELASLDLSRNQPEQARARLETVLKADPYDAEAHYRLALALERLGESEQASAERQKAAQIRADQEALRVLQRRFNESPTDDLRCEIGRWLLEHGRPREGLRWAKTVLGRDPAHLQANILAAEAHEAMNEAGLANFYRLQSRARSQQGAGP